MLAISYIAEQECVISGHDQSLFSLCSASDRLIASIYHDHRSCFFLVAMLCCSWCAVGRKTLKRNEGKFGVNAY
jgi:hypothetical protein